MKMRKKTQGSKQFLYMQFLQCAHYNRVEITDLMYAHWADTVHWADTAHWALCELSAVTCFLSLFPLLFSILREVWSEASAGYTYMGGGAWKRKKRIKELKAASLE